MPQDDKLQQLLLARKVINGALGTDNTMPTVVDPYTLQPNPISPFLEKPQQQGPIPLERKVLSGLIAKSKLFQNPNPEPYRPVESPEILAAIAAIKKENPNAYLRQSGMHFAPLREGNIGNYHGRLNRGDFVIDPAQAMKLNLDNPVAGIVDAIRHEMSHGFGYPDNYAAQPVLKDLTYGRRPLDSSGKARDAQDIDLASSLLQRKQ